MRRVLYGIGYGLTLAAAWAGYSVFNIGWRVGGIIAGLFLLAVGIGNWLKIAREQGK